MQVLQCQLIDILPNCILFTLCNVYNLTPRCTTSITRLMQDHRDVFCSKSSWLPPSAYIYTKYHHTSLLMRPSSSPWYGPMSGWLQNISAYGLMCAITITSFMCAITITSLMCVSIYMVVT